MKEKYNYISPKKALKLKMLYQINDSTNNCIKKLELSILFSHSYFSINNSFFSCCF